METERAMSMRRTQITAQRGASLFGRRFREGDCIDVIPTLVSDSESAYFAADSPFPIIGNGGPWGWGGYRSRDIAAVARKHALRVIDAQNGHILFDPPHDPNAEEANAEEAI